MTNQPYDYEENLPDAEQRTIIGPLSVDPRKLPKYALLELLREKLDELANSPNFSTHDTVYLLVLPDSNSSLQIQTFFSYAFWMVNTELVTWVVGDKPGSYIDTKDTVVSAIDWVLERQRKNIDDERVKFIQENYPIS
jgi:hypothetical protein